MNEPRHRINWPALFWWVVYPASVLAAIAVGLLLMCSCTTTREVHHHHYVQADTLAAQAQADAHMASSTAWVDSLFRSILTQQSASWFSHEDNREVTTETITTTIDSLGREMRTEQRTTERNLSRQQEQRQEQWQHDVESRLQAALAARDSAWQQRLQVLQAHYEQSDSSSVQRDSAPAAASLWQRTKSWAEGAVIGAVLALGLWLTRKWWKKLLKV